MFKFRKNAFSKLYRYYCVKLLSRIWIALLYFAIPAFQLFVILGNKNLADKILVNINSWQEKLFLFWMFSFFQLFVLMITMHPFISYLVGRGLGWKELRKRQIFKIPEISREEDIKVLIFTPDVNRETVILAKFAAAFTYFMAINFFLTTLPLIIYFLVATKLGIAAAFSFLLINGIILAAVNFLLLAPLLFFQQEYGSFLVYFLCSFFLMLFALAAYFLREVILQHPLIFCFLSIPLSVLVGYFFFFLYQKKFLKNDLA